jgi:hypothetical protein
LVIRQVKVTQLFVVKDSASDSPTGIEVEFRKTIRYAACPTDRDFSCITSDRWHTNQQQIAITPHYTQAVLQSQILVAHPNRIAIGIGATSANACKVKAGQQRVDRSWAATALTPTGATVRYLLNDHQLMGIVAIG